MALKESDWRVLAVIFVFICWLTTGEWFYIVPWVVMVSLFALFFVAIIFLAIFALTFRKTYEKHILPFLNRLGINDIRPPKKEKMPILSSYNNEISAPTSMLLSVFIMVILMLILYKIFNLLQEIIS